MTAPNFSTVQSSMSRGRTRTWHANDTFRLAAFLASSLCDPDASPSPDAPYTAESLNELCFLAAGTAAASVGCSEDGDATADLRGVAVSLFNEEETAPPGLPFFSAVDDAAGVAGLVSASWSGLLSVRNSTK